MYGKLDSTLACLYWPKGIYFEGDNKICNKISENVMF